MIYRPDIDGLRAIAVMVVVLFHAGVPLFPGGYVGVDVFFVISGYLITRIIVADHAAGRFSLAGFYERRIRRLFPALAVVTLFSSLSALLILSPPRLIDYGQSLAAVGVFASNLLFWRKAGYFEPFADERPLLHTWSLAVEEQFYLLYPLLLIGVFALASRTGKRRAPDTVLLAVLVPMAVLSLLLCEWLRHRDPSGAFFLLPGRAWELLAGAIVALWPAAKSVPTVPPGAGTRHALSAAAPALGLLAILVASTRFTALTPTPGFASLLPVIGTVLLLRFPQPGTWIWRGLAAGPVVTLGLMSYCVYLWHQPLLAWVRIVTGASPSAAMIGVVVLASLLAGGLTWRFVEQPLRRRGRFGKRTVFAAGASLVAVLVAAGAALHLGRGLPQRFPAETRALAATASPDPRRHQCLASDGFALDPANACVNGVGPTRWAVLGDSHTTELAWALGEALRPTRESVLMLGYAGAAPAAPNPDSLETSKTWFDAALARISADPEIRDVVIAFRWSNYFFGDPHSSIHGEANRPRVEGFTGSDDEARAYLWKGATTTFDRLRAAGKRVIVVKPWPEFPRQIDSLIWPPALPLGLGRSPLPTLARSAYVARNAHVLGLLDSLKTGPDLRVIDPAKVLCDDTICPWVRDGKLQYFDENHVSLSGAARIVGLISGTSR